MLFTLIGEGKLKNITIPDAPLIVMGLQDEIRRNKDARYDHRLHAVLLVARGNSCKQVAEDLGDSLRTVQSWVNAFNKDGFPGLMEAEHSGRPARLTEEQMDIVAGALRRTPFDVGLPGNIWDGKTLSAFIQQRFELTIGVRQCQRLFRELGFRYRKPRPMILGSSAEAEEEFKKTFDG
jgi:transposase